MTFAQTSNFALDVHSENKHSIKNVRFTKTNVGQRQNNVRFRVKWTFVLRYTPRMTSWWNTTRGTSVSIMDEQDKHDFVFRICVTSYNPSLWRLRYECFHRVLMSPGWPRIPRATSWWSSTRNLWLYYGQCYML